MKVYRNSKEINRKDTIGRRLSLTGLGILFVGMIASFVPTMYPPTEPPPTGLIAPFLFQYWSLISFAALPLGFLTASIGSYFINRFARRRWPGSKLPGRPDDVLERSLKGTDDRHALFVYSLPVNHLLAGPFGLIQFAVRSDKGQVTVEGERWREPRSWRRMLTLFAREGVGNPNSELVDQEKHLREFLAKAQANSEETEANLKEANLPEIPIANVVIFLNDAMQLTINNPTIPVIRADQLKDYLRRRNKEVKLSQNTVRVLNEILRQNATYQDESSA